MGIRLAQVLLVVLSALLPAPGTFAAEPVGRLFFTPEQRATLESLRLAPAAAAATTTASDRITVNGIIQRGGGPATVWINGVPRTVPARSLVPEGGTRAPAVRVPVPGKDGQVRLKVGQSIELEVPEAPETDETRAGAGAPGAAPIAPRPADRD